MKTKSAPWQHRRYKTVRGTATFSITLVLFVLGLLALLVSHAYEISEYARRHIGIKVMLKEHCTLEQATQWINLLDQNPMIARVRYISGDEAARELQEELGEDFTDFLGYNPLPASLEVFLAPNYFQPDSTRKVLAYLQGFTLVDEVYHQHELLDDVSSNIRRITTVSLFFSTLLIIISVMLIYSTVRLDVYASRLIIKSMLLVGATGAFIRGPFLRNGLLQGAIGGGGACLLLLAILAILNNWYPETAQFINPVAVMIICACVVLFGLMISGFSNYLAVKKYLKVRSEDLY